MTHDDYLVPLHYELPPEELRRAVAIEKYEGVRYLRIRRPVPDANGTRDVTTTGRRLRRVRVTDAIMHEGLPRLPDGVTLVAGFYRPDYGDWELTLEHRTWRELGEGEQAPLCWWHVLAPRSEITPEGHRPSWEAKP